MLRIQLRVDAPDSGLQIGLSQAVPVALVVNELLTNALKHAFEGGRSGQVEVKAFRVDGKTVVSVSDDGRGLPLATFVLTLPLSEVSL